MFQVFRTGSVNMQDMDYLIFDIVSDFGFDTEIYRTSLTLLQNMLILSPTLLQKE